MDNSGQETAPISQDHTITRNLNRVLSSMKENSRILYKVQWIDQYGQKDISWEPINVLYNFMNQVVQFKQQRLGKIAFILPNQKSELPPINEVPQSQQQSNSIPKKIVKFQDKKLYENMKIIEIKNIPSQLLKKYECQMIDQQTGKLYTIVLTEAQLKQSYIKEFVKFLEHQIYYVNSLV